MAWSCGKGVESYQYLSKPNPTDISFEISSALFGSVIFKRLVGLDDESPFGVVFWRLFPACIVDGIVVSFLVSVDEDGGASIFGDGWTTLRGCGWEVLQDFGVFLFIFLPEFEVFGVLIVILKVYWEREDDEWRLLRETSKT